MILFNDTTSVPGATLTNALAWVANCQIGASRTTMTGVVSLSMESEEPNYPNYNLITYQNVPYAISSGTNPVSQFYTWLMTQTMYEGGTQYPA